MLVVKYPHDHELMRFFSDDALRLAFLCLLPELKFTEQKKCKHADCGNYQEGGGTRMGECKKGNDQLNFALQVLLSKYVDEDKGKDHRAICSFLGIPITGCLKTLKEKR